MRRVWNRLMHLSNAIKTCSETIDGITKIRPGPDIYSMHQISMLNYYHMFIFRCDVNPNQQPLLGDCYLFRDIRGRNNVEHVCISYKKFIQFIHAPKIHTANPTGNEWYMFRIRYGINITIQLFKHKEALVLIHDLWIHNHYQRIIKFANLPKEVCVKQRFVHCVHNGISNSRFCLFQICNWFACNAYTMESLQWHANFMENVSIVWRIGTKT